MTTTTRTQQIDSLLALLAGKTTTPPAELIGRLCEIRRNCPAKWDRFKAGAAVQMNLSADDVAAIVAYVEG